MTVQIRYELASYGWADCTLEMGEQSARVSASYLSDALGDLCDAVADVLAGASRSEAVFAEEPGEYRWIMERVSRDQVRVRIIDNVITRENRGGRVLIDATCPAEQFGRALAADMEHLLASYGEDGYLARWILYPFPRSQFDRLAGLLVNE